MSSEVRVEGLDEIIRKIDSVAKLKRAVNGLRAGAVHIEGKMKQYPGSSIANSPSNPTGRWYERTYGPRWRRRDGSIGGRKTSEDLRSKWTIASEASGLRQVIGNNVSYGIHVQGEKQAHFHAARGWKTTEQVAKEETDTVVNFVKSEIDKDLSS